MNAFILVPVENKEELIGRSAALDLIEKARNNWEITRNPLLVTGAAGFGTTSILNVFENENKGVKDFKNNRNIESKAALIDILSGIGKKDNYVSFEELSEDIDDSVKVVIFEHIERVFHRRIDGFTLLESLLYFINKTKDRVFWIVSINSYGKYYLDNVFGFSTYFLSVLQIEPLTKKEIEQILHGKNGPIKTLFLEPEHLIFWQKRRLNGLKHSARQDWQRTIFFKNLHEFAQGNISRAVLFWRHSLHGATEKRIYLKEYQPDSIQNLKMEDLFILEAIQQHSSLSRNELNVILRNVNFSKKLVLEQLMEKKLIYPVYYEDLVVEYRLNLLYYDQVKRLFKTKLNRNYV